jgi:hypothetical protein
MKQIKIVGQLCRRLPANDGWGHIELLEIAAGK